MFHGSVSHYQRLFLLGMAVRLGDAGRFFFTTQKSNFGVPTQTFRIDFCETVAEEKRTHNGNVLKEIFYLIHVHAISNLILGVQGSFHGAFQHLEGDLWRSVATGLHPHSKPRCTSLDDKVVHPPCRSCS